MYNQIWSPTTFEFYVFIILNCTILSAVTAKMNIRTGNTKNKVKINISLPLLILILMKGFSVCGTDVVNGYKHNFHSAISIVKFRDQSVEFGYLIMNVIIRNITDNYTIFLLICSIFTIAPIYYVFSKYRDFINIPIAIMAYVTLFFFPSLSLLRLYLAASIGLLSFDALVDKKYIKAIIGVFIASTFHVTAIILIIPCLSHLFGISKKMFFATIIFVIAILNISKESISSLFIGRYNTYSVTETTNFGTEFIWFYGPLILLYWYIRNLRKRINIPNSREIRVIDISFVWVLMGIFFSILQYITSIFGRLIGYTLPVVIFIACSLALIKKYSEKSYKWIFVLTIIYFFLRFYIYIVGYYALDGIMPYVNSFGLEI